jgi:Zn-finger nucleic acid-binding protein
MKPGTVQLDVQELRWLGSTAHPTTMMSTGMQPKAVNGDAVGEVEIYQSPDGSVRLDVRTDCDAVWLTRQQIGGLFGRDVKTISKRVANARREELADESSYFCGNVYGRLEH